jgi:hypothetical protein
MSVNGVAVAVVIRWLVFLAPMRIVDQEEEDALD